MPEAQSPDQNSLKIADRILTSYLDHIDGVDAVLFRRFDAKAVSGLQARLREGEEALSHADWDDLSLLLRSVTLSLRPFPDLARNYPADILYKAADDIAAYALTLSGDPPARSTPPKGRKYGF